MTKDFNGELAAIQALGIPALTAFVSNNPQWLAPTLVAAGLFQLVMIYRQDKINDIVTFIQDHPGEFTEKIVATREFQDGFCIMLESYLKQRGEEKLKSIQKIFLDFTKSEDKKMFELEKMYFINGVISYESVRYLKHLEEEIIPKIKAEANRQADHMMTDSELHKGKSRDFWFQDYLKSLSIDFVLTVSGQLKKSTTFVDYVATREEREIINELAGLGIMRIGYRATDFHITEFGYKFIEAISTPE